MSYISRLANAIERIVLRMDSNDWAVAVVVMLAVGIVCMRGMSSKTNF